MALDGPTPFFLKGTKMAIVEGTFDERNLKVIDNFDLEKELPKGKTLNDLTPEEKKRLMDKYRFSGYRPGAYQMITGTDGMC